MSSSSTRVVPLAEEETPDDTPNARRASVAAGAGVGAVSLAASSMSDEGDEIEDDEEDSEIGGEDDGSYQSGESDENF